MKLYDQDLLNLMEEVVKSDTLKYPLLEKRSAAAEGASIGIQNCDRYPGAEMAYVRWAIRNALEEDYKKYWNCRKVESGFSLDKYFSEGDEDAAVMILPALQTTRDALENLICWRDFHNGLNPELNRLLWQVIDGYTVNEICSIDSLEPAVIFKRFGELEKQYRVYFEI